MQVRYLGWAGVELEVGSRSLVIDPLEDPVAVFAFLGEAAAETEVPVVVPATRPGNAVVGLITHLHRDHADAPALLRALRDDASILEPEAGAGEGLENLGLAQAEHELGESGLARQSVAAWESREFGPFLVTALPAADGAGDPQVSWLVEADGVRVLHLGDTLFHGFWWRMVLRHGPFDLVFAPINGAVLDVPHRQPPSPLAAAMEPEQAAIAGAILGARIVVPMHYDGLTLDPLYQPVADAEARFLDAASDRGFETRILQPGESLELAPAPAQVA